VSGSAALKTILTFKFEVLTGPHSGKKFVFDKASITFGRGTENDVILSEDPKVSRQHMEIKYSNGEFRVFNLSQKNFTLINGRKGDNQVINYGDKITIGESEILFSLDQQGTNAAKNLVAKKDPETPMRPYVVPPPVAQSPSMPAKSYTAPPMSAPSTSPSTYNPGPVNSYSRQQASQGFKVNKFYVIVAIVVLALVYLITSGTEAKKKQGVRFDAPPTVQQEIVNAERVKKEMEEKKRRMDSLQYQRAEENFIKGFRDYRQGQYARAQEAFQVALNLNPEHLEAQRYLTLSRLKFDEQVKLNLQQGRINFENRNYRLCKSSFQTVMTMLNQRQKDPSYIDAKKFFDACDLALGGR
jgi:pSer/pThr/pTyr-binding forkhead associated (FHA) protein